MCIAVVGKPASSPSTVSTIFVSANSASGVQRSKCGAGVRVLNSLINKQEIEPSSPLKSVGPRGVPSPRSAVDVVYGPNSVK